MTALLLEVCNLAVPIAFAACLFAAWVGVVMLFEAIMEGDR